jgi:hypothetical protein
LIDIGSDDHDDSDEAIDREEGRDNMFVMSAMKKLSKMLIVMGVYDGEDIFNSMGYGGNDEKGEDNNDWTI